MNNNEMRLELTRDQLSLIYQFGEKSQDDNHNTYYHLPFLFKTTHDSRVVELIPFDKLQDEITPKFKKKK